MKKIFLIFLSLLFLQCNKDKNDINQKVETITADSFIEDFAKKTNSICPQIINDTITLDSCIVLPNTTISFNYTLKYTNKDYINNLEKDIIEKTIMTEEKKDLFDIGISLNYLYKDTDGKEVHGFTVNPRNYFIEMSRIEENSIDEKE